MNPLRLLLPLSALAGTSQAAIIHSGIQNILIPTTFVGVYIDIDGGGTVPEEGVGWDVNLIFNGEGIANSQSFHPVAATVTLDAPVLNLTYGTAVSSGSTFATPYPSGYSSSATHIGNSPGQFASSTEGYIGFQFSTNSSAGPYFGWIRVELSNTAATGLIKDWAYEDTGASIAVGAVPEPSAVLSLFAGATAFCYRRRR
jgi:hypothetical protein